MRLTLATICLAALSTSAFAAPAVKQQLNLKCNGTTSNLGKRNGVETTNFEHETDHEYKVTAKTIYMLGLDGDYFELDAQYSSASPKFLRREYSMGKRFVTLSTKFEEPDDAGAMRTATIEMTIDRLDGSYRYTSEFSTRGDSIDEWNYNSETGTCDPIDVSKTKF